MMINISKELSPHLKFGTCGDLTELLVSERTQEFYLNSIWAQLFHVFIMEILFIKRMKIRPLNIKN